MRKVSHTLWACLLVMFVATNQASGHRLNFASTHIAWQPDQRSLEVTHQIHLDDGVRLLATLGSSDAVLDARTMAQLLRYTDANFDISDRTGPIKLTPVGAEMSGDVLYIYQELLNTPPSVALQVSNRLLQDVFAGHRNQVNFAIGDAVVSHTFTQGSGPRWLTHSTGTPDDESGATVSSVTTDTGKDVTKPRVLEPGPRTVESAPLQLTR